MRLKAIRMAAAAALAAGCGGWLAGLAQAPASGGVYVLTIDDGIGPATSDYIGSGIDDAVAAEAELIVLEMNTPGGLDTSMREIIQAILASPVPVASYVYPEGARAASAGTYILYASHIAAMAPATNLGAATPVAIGGSPPPPPSGNDDILDDIRDLIGSEDDEEADAGQGGDAAAEAERETPREEPYPEPVTTSDRKAINDAVAYIRSLAERRGRNADWAERAVRGSESLSADAALALGVIDLIAASRSDLLRQLDGRVIDGRRLALPASTPIVLIEPDWRNRLLAVISNPTLAYMLLLLGIYGLIFEGYNPGAIVPGVVGAISLLLALYALQILQMNYAGLALIVLGLILMVAEFFVPSFGALGIGGIAAFIFGSLIIFDSDVPGFEVATSLIVSMGIAASLAMMATVWLALRARERRIVSGVEELSGMSAEALEDFDGEGPVWVHGERWRARTAAPVSKGQRLTVTRVDGLVLEVEPAARQPS